MNTQSKKKLQKEANMAEDIEALIDALPKKEPVIKVKSRPFKCQFCPQAFMAIKTKRYHERSKHPEEFKDSPNLLQFICDECGLEFKRNWNLNNHKATVHNTERKFKCDAVGCLKMFKTNQSRNEHIKIHTTTYTCTFEDCNKIFKAQQAYSQHLGMHMGNQFPCTFPGCDHPPYTRKRVIITYYYYCYTYTNYVSLLFSGSPCTHQKQTQIQT